MKKTKIGIYLYIVIVLLSCKRTEVSTEIFQNNRTNIINVEDNISPIPLDTSLAIPIGKSQPYIIGKYLIIEDHQAIDKAIHLFNKNDFTYISSTGNIGQGPGELTTASQPLIPDLKNNRFFISDLGKQKLYEFDIDSIINNFKYLPKTKLYIKNLNEYILRMTVLNDSIFIVKTGKIKNNKELREEIGKLNINTGEIVKLGYQNPEIKTNRDTYSTIALSQKYKVYVYCYFYKDLITICDTAGNLQYNIYGPKWNNNEKNIDFYKKADIYKNKIITSYLGDRGIILDENKRPKAVRATKILVFDLQGNYLKTMETNHEIRTFCVDEENNRLIIYFEDLENPFSYLDLTGLLD